MLRARVQNQFFRCGYFSTGHDWLSLFIPPSMFSFVCSEYTQNFIQFALFKIPVASRCRSLQRFIRLISERCFAIVSISCLRWRLITYSFFWSLCREDSIDSLSLISSSKCPSPAKHAAGLDSFVSAGDEKATCKFVPSLRTFLTWILRFISEWLSGTVS